MEQIATHEWTQKMIDNREIMPGKMAEIPFFYDGVSAGKFDSSSNETDETMKVFLLMNENPDVMFAVRVRGDSMIDCTLQGATEFLSTHKL